MTRGIKLFTYQDIPVFLHWSFGLIVFYIGYIAYSSNLNIDGTLWLSGIFCLFFMCVILHEFGHALMAKKYGISTKDIVLTPIGGVARLLRIPKSPRQELAVAIAGPLVNIVIASVLAISIFQFIPEQLNRYDPIDINNLSLKEFVFILCIGNGFLAIFNLIPAFPMDGGRILRALLSMKLSRTRATQWASYMGRFFALLFIIYGLYFSNYILAFIGVFVFMSAGVEYRQLKFQDRISAQKVSEVFFQNPPILSENHPIDKDFNNHGYIVIDLFGHPIGLFQKEYLKSNPSAKTIGEVMHRKLIPVQLEDSIQKAIYLMQQNEVNLLPVYQNGQLIGILDSKDIWRQFT